MIMRSYAAALDMLSDKTKENFRAMAPPLLHVADKDAKCQTILGMYDKDLIADHIVGDMNDRLPPCPRTRLDRFEPSKEASPQAKMEAYHFMRTELSDFFLNVDLATISSDCKRCNKQCCPYHPSLVEKAAGNNTDSEEWLQVEAGLVCVDWSHLGKMLGYAGQHTRMLYIFCAEVMALKPELVITECVEDEDSSRTQEETR